MSISDVVCTCGATPERDSVGRVLPCMRCYFGASDQPHDRIAQLEAELAELRVKYDAACKGSRERLDVIMRTQAEAAAMRATIANVLAERYRLGDFAAKAERMADVARKALDAVPDAGRAIADRVPLWRELSGRVRTGNTICGHGYPVRPVADCDACEIEQILRKLAALDEKGTP